MNIAQNRRVTVAAGSSRSRVLRNVGLAVICAVALLLVRQYVWSRDASKTVAPPSSASVNLSSAQPSEQMLVVAQSPGVDAPLATLSGRVATISAERSIAALAGASVCLIASNDEQAVACTVTNQEGRFSLANAGCRVGARLVASALGYSSASRTIESEPGCTDRAIVLSLQRGGEEVAGTVVDATGGVIVGARVVWSAAAAGEPPVIVQTVADGSFRLTAPKGKAELVANADGYSRAVRQVVAPERGVVIVLAPASTIAGEVVLGSGEPVPRAHVTAKNPNGIRAPAKTAETDESGQFVLTDLPAGGYEVWATTERLRTEKAWANVAVGENGSVRLVAVPASSLRASLDVAGSPCAAGHVTLEGPSGSTQPIDPEGNVRFEGLSRGRYQVNARCTSVVSDARLQPPKRHESFAELAEVVIVEDEAATAHWSATEPEHPEQDPSDAPQADSPKGSISGRVVDDQGNPVPETWVTASGTGARGAAPSMTDSSGAFVLTGLANGTYEIAASSSFGEGRVSNVTLNSTNVLIRVGLYGAISGSVQTADGAPAESFTLFYRERSEAGPRVLNGAQGKWALPWLPAGSYRLSAVGASGCGWSDTQLKAGAKVQVSISLTQSGEACGAMLGGDGRAAALDPRR